MDKWEIIGGGVAVAFVVCVLYFLALTPTPACNLAGEVISCSYKAVSNAHNYELSITRLGESYQNCVVGNSGVNCVTEGNNLSVTYSINTTNNYMVEWFIPNQAGNSTYIYGHGTYQYFINWDDGSKYYIQNGTWST